MNRTFTYNSLSRLTAAVQPESGTTTYTYWPNGDLYTKTDNRGARTAVAYDALNRVTSKTYTLGGNLDPATPNVSFQYYTNTSVPSAYGQLHSMSTQAQGAYTGLVSTTTYDSFDALGRVTGSTQTTGTGAAKTMGYTWYANGEMHTETLPSGRLLTNALTGSGHVLSVTGQTSAGSQTYASGAQYGPQGVLSHVTLGNNLREDRGYDGLLRTQSITQTNLGTNAVPLQFTYGFYADGNPQTIAAGAITQSFTFDGVNRLKTAQETTTAQTWFQQYNYDFAGNRWLDGSSSFQGQAPISQNWYDSTTNRVSAGYDGAGNILTLNNLTNSYDAEGNMTSSGNSTSGVVTYSYDGAGHRVASSSYLGNKTFIYDAQDQLVAEYSDKASGTTGTLYLGTDGLGSTRVVTDASGAVVRCLDYLPFGEELSQGLSGRPSCFGNYTYPAGGDDSVSEKFTGAKRDGETGLDFLESRYYAGYLGRFMSPDKPLADQNPSNPQSWNLYSYGRNNPLSFIDPTGTTCLETQTKNDDGTLTNGVADNGDGAGCGAAGVASGFGSNTITSQQVNVNDQQGSWLDYLRATTFNQIPRDYSNDVPLNSFAQQLVKAVGQKISAYPTICGGGLYLYSGRESSLGPVNSFVGLISEHDSKSGSSTGALVEGGYGEGVTGGVGGVLSTSGGRPQLAGLAYGGVGAHSPILSGSVGVVGFGSAKGLEGVGVYAEGFTASRGGGVGAYLNITNVGSCH